jgi:hypothetical protein
MGAALHGTGYAERKISVLITGWGGHQVGATYQLASLLTLEESKDFFVGTGCGPLGIALFMADRR